MACLQKQLRSAHDQSGLAEDRLKTQLAQKQTELSSLRTDYERLRDAMNQKEAETRKLQDTLARLRDEQREAAAEKDRQQREISQLRQQLAGLSSQKQSDKHTQNTASAKETDAKPEKSKNDAATKKAEKRQPEAM